MNELRSTLTELGKKEIKEALAKEKTVQWNKIAVGDGNGSEIYPHEMMVQLENQCWVGNVMSRVIDVEDPQKVTFHATIPNAVMGFTIREVGILNDSGQLMAVSRSNEIDKDMGNASGGYIDVDIYFSVIVQDARCIELVVDQNVEFATRNSLEAVGNRVSDLEDRAAGYDKELSDINDNIGLIQGNITIINNDIKNLQSGLSDLRSELAQFKEYNFKDLEKRVAKLEDTLEGVDKLLEIV